MTQNVSMILGKMTFFKVSNFSHSKTSILLEEWVLLIPRSNFFLFSKSMFDVVLPAKELFL